MIAMMREESGQGAEEVQGGGGEEQDAAWDHGWDELAEAELAFDPDDPICGVVADDDDVIVASDGREFQMARAASSPKAPSKEIQARHNLTHLPYAPWCPWCVMGRRANSPHFRSSGSDRSLPLFVADYAFVRNREDEVTCKLLVGKLYPSRKVLACVVDSKGVVDPYGVNRVAAFFRESGLTHFEAQSWVVKSDQETSILALLKAAIKKSGRNGTIVPEASAVSESASNARAERTVQAVEDLLRMHKHALEARIGRRLGLTNPRRNGWLSTWPMCSTNTQ